MITLDYRDKRPIYEQVTEKITNLIVCGALSENTKMPSVRQLALDLSVNPNTIQRSYNELENQGFIYSVVGRGNFVSPKQEWDKSLKENKLLILKDIIISAKNSGIKKSAILELLNAVYSCSKEDGHD